MCKLSFLLLLSLGILAIVLSDVNRDHVELIDTQRISKSVEQPKRTVKRGVYGYGGYGYGLKYPSYSYVYAPLHKEHDEYYGGYGFYPYYSTGYHGYGDLNGWNYW